MPPPDQVLMGTAIAATCLVGAWHSLWLVEQTRKGQRLAEVLGAGPALWIVRSALICGAMLGALLATGVVNPLRW
jgi:hypothetical protein